MAFDGALLRQGSSYLDLYRSFRWQLPERFNIGTAIADRWAAHAPDRPALLAYAPGRGLTALSYGELASRSNALARALRVHGVRRGDRVALLLGQSFDTAIAHAAIYKLGAIAVPLALLFGMEALEYRLQTAGVRAIITNSAGQARLGGVAGRLPTLELMVSTDGGGGAWELARLVADHAGAFEAEPTGPDDPAMMIFTSGTTGPPKGALHGHRVLLGHLPGVEMPHDSSRSLATGSGRRRTGPGPAACSMRCCPRFTSAFRWSAAGRRNSSRRRPTLIEAAGVRNAFLPPTALRMLQPVTDPGSRFRLDLRTSAQPAKRWAARPMQWGREALGLTVNDFYGQTECNCVLGLAGRSASAAPARSARAVPGHRVAIIDGGGRAAGRRGRRDRRREAGPGDVPGILEQPGGDARGSSSATG